MPLIINLLTYLVVLIYCTLIISFFIGWLRTPYHRPEQKDPVTRISILIPCRNEARNIPEMYAMIARQEYPVHLLQVIWINDHSEDGSESILENLTKLNDNHLVISLNDGRSGKKEALKAGMEPASGDLILLTDADSRPGPLWVKSMARFFEDTGTDLILGPVMLDPALSAFDKIQKLEYLSLVASSVGAAGIGRPVMAQGPNMAVRATDYHMIVGDLNSRFASGDDVFLLQAMKNIPGKKIRFNLNPDAIVRSKPVKTLSGFLRQRSRWASKAPGYEDPFMILTTLSVFSANLLIFIGIICTVAGIVPLPLVFGLFALKLMADLPLLAVSTRFFRCRSLMWWVIPVQLIYPIYITTTGILSQLVPVRWK